MALQGCVTHSSEEIGESTSALASPESQCGPGWDVQDVESYDGTLGTTRDFVDRRQAAVGYHVGPGCTGTLISEDLFISAGHCGYSVGDAIRFNYQNAPDGTARATTDYTVSAVVEQEQNGSWDYAIVRLNGNPGRVWGYTSITEKDPTVGSRVTIIQHPARVAKVVHAGAVVDYASVLGENWFRHAVDTVGGSSGSGVLDEDGLLVGIHTNAGCSTSDPVNGNSAIRMSRLVSHSPTLRALTAAPLQQVSSKMCIHPRGGSATPDNSTEIVLWDDCSNEDRLKFELTKDGSLRHASSGKCLHPLGGSSNPPSGTPLVLHDGCGEARLQFVVTSGGSLQHVSSGKCVHPESGGTTPANDTRLVLDDRCDEDQQHFASTPHPQGRLAHVSGLCIHPFGGSSNPADGTMAVLWNSCASEPRLNLIHRADGGLQQASSQKCLVPQNPTATPVNGVPVVFSASCGTAASRFERLPNGSLRHLLSAKCVHPQGGSAFPDVDTPLVLHDGCGDERLEFFSVTF